MGGTSSTAKGKIVAVLALVAIVGAAGALWAFFWSAPKPELARWMPNDVVLYVEAPSTTKLLVALAGVDVLDRKELDLDKRRDDLVAAVAEGLDVSDKDAKAFVMGVRGIAVGMRQVDDDADRKKKQAAIFVAFDATSSVRPILASKRFAQDGKLESGAVRWKRAAAKGGDDDDDHDDAASDDKLEGWARRVQRVASSMDGSTACALWESQKLLGCGDKAFLEDVDAVVRGKAPGLSKSAQFEKAAWPSGTQIFAWLDPSVIDDEKVREQWFDGVGPMVGSLRMTRAGLVLGARVELKGDRVPTPELSPASPPKLSLAKRLPAGTVGYLAFSSRTKGSYEDFEKALLKSVERQNEAKAKRLEKQLDRMETEAGFTLKTLYETVGDEGVIGVFGERKVSLESFQSTERAFDDLGLVYLQKVRDKAKAKELLEDMRKRARELGGMFAHVKKLDDGFAIEPEREGWPSASVTLDDGYFVVAVGRSKAMEVAKKAFHGESDTLAKDKAHAKAMEALDGDNVLVVWVDAGRLAKSAIDDDVREQADKAGIPLGALRLEGDDRVTMASALRVSAKDKAWVVEMTSLNGPDPLLLGLVGVRRKHELGPSR